MKLILPILLVSFGLGGTAPHKFEDGFVERTLAIVVRDNLATAEYSLGLNQATIEALLTQWNSESKTTADENSAHLADSETSLGKPDSAIPQVSPTLKTEKTEIENFKSKPIAPDSSSSASSTAATATSKSSVYQAESTPGPSASASAKINLEEEDVISEEVFEEFKMALATQITKSIQISGGEKELAVKEVSVQRAPRHPFNLVVKFQFEIPQQEICELRIVDKNFARQDGAVRYSLKALGNTILLKSNVAPIIVRSKRVELKGLSQKETAQQTSISVRLAAMPTTKTDDQTP